MHNGIAPQRSGRNSATQLYLQATSAQQQYTAVLQSRFVRKQSHSWSPPPHGGPQSSEGMCRGDCLESSPSTARARKRTRWGIGPRAFHTRDGCDTTTPCAHGILAQVGTYSSEHQCSSGRIQGSQPSPTLLLVCFVCVCVLSWLSSWLGGGLGAMSRRREIHGAATITARRPATLRAQALHGRLEPS